MEDSIWMKGTSGCREYPDIGSISMEESTWM